MVAEILIGVTRGKQMDLAVLKEKYRLRNAAGTYWIIDVEQPGVPYREPLAVNVVGKKIWGLILDGFDDTQIADELCNEYEADRQQVLSDIESFKLKLKANGIGI